MNSGPTKAWLLAALIACAALPLAGQQRSTGTGPTAVPRNAPEYTLKTSVNRVLVDVVVTDAHGSPVHGLTKSDFTVAEDGVPQKVLAFDAHNFNKFKYVPPKMPALAPGSFVNLPPTPERGPLYVLYYDLVNIPQKYQVTARAQLVKFIRNLPEGARFAMIVDSDGVRVVQGFTSDKRKLLAAVDPKHEKPHVPWIFLMGPNFGEGDRLAATVRLGESAHYLAPMPGRKNLIWFAAEFPVSLFPVQDDTASYREKLKRTLNLLADEQISVYPVDVSGVVPYMAYAPSGNAYGEGITKDDRDWGILFPDPAKPKPRPRQKGFGYSLLQESYWTQDAIAEVTGGRAIYSSNDLTGALEKVTEDGGSYYTLAYSPPNKNFDGHLRRIRVKLKDGEKYHLAYRRAYYGLPPEKMKAPAADPIESVMEHGAPEEHHLIFGVHVTPNAPKSGAMPQAAQVTNHRKKTPSRTYAIHYTVMARQLRAAGDTSPHLEIAAAAYDADGNMLNSTVNQTEEFRAAGKKTSEPKAYRAEVNLAVPHNAKFMRFAVRDQQSGKLGVMEITLPIQQ